MKSPANITLLVIDSVYLKDLSNNDLIKRKLLRHWWASCNLGLHYNKSSSLSVLTSEAHSRKEALSILGKTVDKTKPYRPVIQHNSNDITKICSFAI